YSVGLHFLAAVFLLRMLSGAAVKPGQVYTIDFVGPSAMVQAHAESEAEKSAPTAAAAENGKPPPDSQFDEFGRRKNRKTFVLPRPSLMRGFQAQDKEQQQQTESRSNTQAPAAGASAPDGGGGGPAGAGIETDMPNFPYPWYISQVRAALWNQWSARMPKEQGSCVVVFSILPNGTIVDLRAEESSG